MRKGDVVSGGMEAMGIGWWRKLSMDGKELKTLIEG